MRPACGHIQPALHAIRNHERKERRRQRFGVNVVHDVAAFDHERHKMR